MDNESYSSETEDELHLKEIDEQYFNEMATTRDNKVDFFIEKSDSISSWRVI